MTEEKIQKRWDDRKQKCMKCAYCGRWRPALSRRWRFASQYSVWCRKCYHYGPSASTIGGAVRRWNRFNRRLTRDEHSQR